MRDIDRIDKILNLISYIWHRCPDMRLGQLLICYGGFTTEDNFFLEDDIIEEELVKSAEGIKRE